MLRCPSCTAELDDASRFCAACGHALVASAATTVAAPATPLPPTTRDPTPRDPTPRDTPPPDDAHSQGRFLPGIVLARRYRLVALLGRGGMGEVYRADDTRLGQTVALKFLPDTVARDAATLERFYAEVRIGRQVSHPNVCRLYDLVEIEGHHCLVMEYVDGEDLASLLARIGRLPPDKAVDIARDLCAGLGAAHDKGVIHRDLKPANVMIDGKGRARIADFGIAALAGEVDKEAFAGTPAYMAPELLDGKPASVRSDLYALGLVLYETCTGKRLFEARSLSELKALQQHTGPISLSSTVRDIPPAMERVVLRCLARDPADRPASAHEAMAALPGGDPLQAAMAAGETPSPAMVAAAGQVGDLAVRVAWTWLLAALLGLVLIAWLSTRSTMVGLLAPEKSPVLLTARAQEIVAALGYDQPPQDHEGLFVYDENYYPWLATRDASSARWNHLASVRPGPLQYVYRQSPRELVATQVQIRPMGPGEVGRVMPDDPAATTPGMVDITLDARGRLLGLRAVPLAASTPIPVTPDWSALFAAADLDPALLTRTVPRAPPPVAADTQMAWQGHYRDQPDVALHIEAAAFHGRPVWLDVQGPWWRPPAVEFPVPWRIAIMMMLVFSAFIWVVIAVLVRRNLRMGRGDRRGALRLSLFLLASSIVALMVRADHVALAFEEAGIVSNLLAQALLYAVLCWLMYMALEPIARRRWPTLLVGWSRLLAGRMRDPLVGRDVLVGAAAGIAIVLVLHLSVVVPAWLGLPAPQPRSPTSSLLSGFHNLVFFLLWCPYPAVCVGFGTLLGLYLYRLLARLEWLALVIQAVSLYFLFAIFTGTEQLWSPPLVAFTVIYLVTVLRAGLLAAVAAIYTFMVLEVTPLTADLSAWYADRMVVAMLLLGALLAYGFHCSLGGKPMFGSLLAERE